MRGIVRTIAHRCKRCYHCVRHCPARAIRVVDGQAQVVEERCIACGNCYRVCAQRAKQIESGIPAVWDFLVSEGEVVAALAPSFPPAFHPVRPGQLVTALRRLGFTRVVEVAFGADLVARRFRKLAASGGPRTLMTTPCPALVTYVEKFAPALVPSLAPIVSPMIATGRALKALHWPDARIVFIGPCTAKKNEIRDPGLAGAVDAVLTFDELRDMLAVAEIAPEDEPDGEFDPPRAALGRVFPVSGGLLRTAEVESDVLDNAVMVCDGMLRVQRLVEDLQKGEVSARFVDVLFCEGCINGPVMSGETGEFARKEMLVDYVKAAPPLSAEEAEAFLARYDDVDLSRQFCGQPIEVVQPTEQQIAAVLTQVGKYGPENELNCAACGYSTCREKAIAVCQGLAEVEMCLPYLVERTQEALEQITSSHAALASAQERLVQAEKLAAVGQLAAGVAHQVNNPLATVLLYSHLVLRQLATNDPRRDDLETIAAEATRCRNIIVALLNFARQNRLTLTTFDLNALLESALSTEARKTAGLQVVCELCPDLPLLTADAEQLTQVFKNIIENAVEAMGGSGTLTVRTMCETGERVSVQFADTGPGVPPDALDHLFDPFFTTKPPGQGTGLGLAIARGIVKMHRGDITAGNGEQGGAVFTVTLPVDASGEGNGHDAIGQRLSPPLAPPV
jgi:two-component system NtrC family sensor kinase